MEQVVVTHPAVAECAVIGLPDDLKGEVPLGFVTLKAGAAVTQAELEPQLVALVRDQIGPVAAFKHAVIVEKLPKTRSGKILRATLRLMAAGQSVAMPPTIDDPDAIRAVRDALAEIHAGA
jgi:propionyl-CoA synthetase